MIRISFNVAMGYTHGCNALPVADRRKADWLQCSHGNTHGCNADQTGLLAEIKSFNVAMGIPMDATYDAGCQSQTGSLFNVAMGIPTDATPVFQSPHPTPFLPSTCADPLLFPNPYSPVFYLDCQ